MSRITFYFVTVMVAVLFFSAVGQSLIITSPTTTSSWTMYTTVCVSWFSKPGDGSLINRIDVVSPLSTKTIFPAVALSKGRHTFLLSGIETNDAVHIRVTTDTGVVQTSGNFKVGLFGGDRDCHVCAPPMQTCVSSGAGCESSSNSDAVNCGSCGNTCSSNHVPSVSCSGGICNGACESGWSDCNNNKLTDGCETHSDIDVFNCGTCGTVCSTNNINRACAGGSCSAGTCSSGWTDCNNNKQLDGCEIHTDIDTSNCGTCNTVCSTNNINRACVGGSCSTGTCFAGWTDCNNNKQLDGCEIHTDVDVLNCGTCNTVCSTNHITRVCSGGTCNAGTCASGYADCNNDKQSDGCEINLTNNVLNCGSCGNACSLPNATPTCSGSSCIISSCNAGWANCDGNPANGCETHTAVDGNNCGSCGNVCSIPNGTPTCSGSSCIISSCNSGFADCDGVYSNGCECPSTYWASGVQNNVPTSALVGWTLCFSDTYSSVSSIATMQSNCNQANLLVACAPVGSSILNVLAMAPRSDVFFDVGNGPNSVHPANGVNWYFSQSWSMGFAPGGAGVNRNSCDIVEAPGFGFSGPTQNQRLCWHTSSGSASSGWRCGQNDSLFTGSWARYIYQSP